MKRRPFALSNWKMSMTVTESLAFVRDFQNLGKNLLSQIDVVICPAYTSLWPVAQALEGTDLQLGAQNIAPTADLARTGEISATLLADVGCRWVMLGHWEIRRHLGDNDTTVNRKVHLVLEAGLTPILLIGEGRNDDSPSQEAIEKHLAAVLDGCQAEQAAKMVFVYEPEGAIGVSTPAAQEWVAVGCSFIRNWLHEKYGVLVSNQVRIIYGGSVTPEHAANLLTHPDIDGLGATRRGRNPATFIKIVEQVVKAKSRN